MISTRRDILHVLGFLPLLASSASSSAPFRGPMNSDVSALGRYFPQLATMHNGHPLAYLDSAATTLRPWPVLEAMVDFYQSRNANPGQRESGGSLHFMRQRLVEASWRRNRARAGTHAISARSSSLACRDLTPAPEPPRPTSNMTQTLEMARGHPTSIYYSTLKPPFPMRDGDRDSAITIELMKTQCHTR